MPLGSGALAGTELDIRRDELARELGFNRPSPNSIDAVSDRDFVCDMLFALAMIMEHMSRLSEQVILWCSQEYSLAEMDDAWSTGSSLMPQKKNPDALELMRGKSGRVIGHLTGLLTTLKGLPTAYNKDLQEDKEGLFDAIDTLKMELPIASGVIRTLEVKAERMAEALEEGMLATDLADYLVRKGVPFRQSHHLVGEAVRRAEESGVSLDELELSTYQAISPAFDEDVYEVFDFERSVEARAAEGGTAPSAVWAQVERAREALGQRG
jgi:argininosuccinate lyase